ncbi:MAG: translocation/assembly module TamB domain-containing protein [Gammaproteobacteria bacterium]|nr:translocation/assembly module TamB domain-containing protein [Gammaproteobacteria bacterium]
MSLSELKLEDSPEFEAEVQAEWRKGKVALSAQLQEARGNPLILSASLPVKASGERHLPQLEEDKKLQMNLDWQGDIEPLWTLLPLPEHRLQGEATMSLALRGSFDKPSWQGAVSLADAQYENLTHGTLLQNVTLQATLQEAKRVLLQLSAEDGQRGTVKLSGAVGLFAPEKTALNIVIKNALLLRNDALRLQADADLDFVDQADGYLLSGRAEAKSVLLNLAQQLPPSVVDLEVIELNDEALSLEGGTASAEANRIKLDLHVDMPRRVYLRGRGLESEWGGSLKVKGDTAQPRVSGRLQVLSGDFVFVGRQFDFERGSIEFYGSDEIDPQLDFLLSHPSASMTTQFLLSGLASKPTLTLSSDDPNLPEDEVLSKMLFDKGSTDLSPLEVLELTQAVAELSGLLSGGGGGVSLDSILGALRQAFGFDVLRIRAGDAEGEGATVDMGKYLSDSVYVGVRQGAQPEDSEVTVEIEISPEVKFESRVGEANKNRSSLKWEWDY